MAAMAVPRLQFRLSTLIWITLAVAGFFGGMATERWLQSKRIPPVDLLPLPPCHPGCFPAGTLINVPIESKPIERIREGDMVTTVGTDGIVSEAEVAAVFVTRNRLLDVQTDAGNLVTTQTQPLALVGGGLRAAGELKAGDRIFRWNGIERQVVTVRTVSATGREESVFNLILVEPGIFVANGFLARSKPPAPSSLTTAEEVAPEAPPTDTME
jgi:hypothetical protein